MSLSNILCYFHFMSIYRSKNPKYLITFNFESESIVYKNRNVSRIVNQLTAFAENNQKKYIL